MTNGTCESKLRPYIHNWDTGWQLGVQSCIMPGHVVQKFDVSTVHVDVVYGKYPRCYKAKPSNPEIHHIFWRVYVAFTIVHCLPPIKGQQKIGWEFYLIFLGNAN